MLFSRRKPARDDAVPEKEEDGPEPGTSCRRMVAGLGNPGEGYARTRHNVGFMVVNRIARELKAKFERHGKVARLAGAAVGDVRCFMVKPRTFMNRSGHAVGQLAERLDVDVNNILVVLDDFSLPAGKLRFRAHGSDGGHNGLASVIRCLGTDKISRLRCGIGSSEEQSDAADFVLSEFEPHEADEVEKMIKRAAEGVRLWLETGDLECCMNRFNHDPDA